MAAQIGQFALALAWVVTAYSVIASLIGIRLKNDNLIASARNAALGTFASITTAIVCLGYLFAISDFSIKYIAAHSNRDLPIYFKVSSIWGGQEGSLLFWGWLLTLYTALVIIQNWRKHTSTMPYVIAVLMTTSLFFTTMHLFAVNPFNQTVILTSQTSPIPFVPRDGNGLNPLLQDAYMVIHPPMLYLGFVGFAVPFAFAMGAMITKQMGDTWIRTTRRWTMVAWMFLSIGILLGGKWAYHELGWGGFWAWDPVENASLMPWLIGTAFLHSVMVQEKKGMMKVWNMVLVIMSYIMSIFGTFLTRSGVVNSVHAFAQSPIGGYFAAFIVVALSASFYLLIDRLRYLKSENQMESMVSRESSFMFNNLILLAACFAVFWGTMFPVISEAVTGRKITVSAPFFNKVNVPIAIFLMFLTGVGPLLAWRKASTDSLKRNFLTPAIMALAAGVVLYIRGWQHLYAWVALVMSIFVAITIVREFYKGAKARTVGTGERFLEAVVNLTFRNTRRYGGYIVHFAFVLMFVGWSGQAFTTDAQADMGIGDTMNVREYTLRMEKLGTEDNANYSAQKASVGLFAYGKKVAVLHPERRVYKAGPEPQPTSEVAIYSTARNDVYVVFAAATTDQRQAVIQVFYNPLTMWVWIGGIVLVIGTLIALLPNKKTVVRRRPEIESKEESKTVEAKV
jgi:cytochrome c-type biogenesis protein CcmF